MDEFINNLVKINKNKLENMKLDIIEVEDSTSIYDCKFIYLLIRQLQPTVILEIGTWVGSTLSSIIQACEDNNKPYKIYTIDINKNLQLDKKKLSNVEVCNGMSQDILKKLNEKNIMFDFVFSDADLNVETAKILDNMITKKTFFSTHDFVPPNDKGITSVFNIIKYTKLKNNKLIMPSYKCNWIYEKKISMHDDFSKDYVKNKTFNTKKSHNDKFEINNCVALICNQEFLNEINFDENNKSTPKILNADEFILNKNYYNEKNYLHSKNENIMIVSDFKDDLPYVLGCYIKDNTTRNNTTRNNTTRNNTTRNNTTRNNKKIFFLISFLILLLSLSLSYVFNIFNFINYIIG